MARRHHRRSFIPVLPLIPFLSIMLGLMCVMALTTLGVSVEERRERRNQQYVKLVGVPEHLVPVQLRCTANGVHWQEGEQTHFLPDLALLRLAHDPQAPISPEAIRLLTFLQRAAAENRELSFRNQRHSLLLWVEPEGVHSAAFVAGLVGSMALPLRIGQLPVDPEQEVVNDVPAGR